MSAYKVGVKVGDGAGFVAAKLWHVTCAVAAASGDIGQGLVDGSTARFEKQELLDRKTREAKAAARKLEVAAVIAARKAAAEAAPVLEAAQATPMAVA